MTITARFDSVCPKCGEWVYEQGLISHVANLGRKMTMAEAKQFTLLYGQCVRCGRKLVDARSVERAMGPVCVQYFGDKF